MIGAVSGPYVRTVLESMGEEKPKLVEFNQNKMRIAVINLDTGVEKNGKQVYYAGKIIEYPDERYKSTSLEEAKEGMKKDLYGAYIVIPSTFSTSVDSINTTPQKAVFEYKINPNLKEEDRDEMIYEIAAFQESISTNVSYIFVDAILNEVHNIQNGAATVLKNDDSESTALAGVNAEELIFPVEFTELEENNETVKPVDLSNQSQELQNALLSVENNFEDALENGEKAYEGVVKKDKDVKDALDKLEKGVEHTNPLYDDKGDSTIKAGLESVNDEIDASHQKIEGQRSLLETAIVKEINAYSTRQVQGSLVQSRNQIEKDVQEKVFNTLSQKVQSTLQQKNEENRSAVEEIMNNYTLALQSYLDERLESDEVKDVISEIVRESTEQRTEELEAEYEQQTTELKSAYSQQAEKIKAAAEEVKSAQEDSYEEKVADLLEIVEAMPTEIPVPEESDDEEGEQEQLSDEQQTDEPQTDELQPEEPQPEEPQPEESMDLTELKKQIQITGTESGSGTIDPDTQPVKAKDYLKEIPRIEIPLSWEELGYSVSQITLEEETKANQETLKEIENLYKIPKDHVTKAFQTNVVDVLSARNTAIQSDLYGKISQFFLLQGSYQTTLNQFDPYQYLDRTELSEDITKIADNISGIEEEMNETGSQYLDYTADVYKMTNENILTLQDDITKANEKTSENVSKQIGALKESRTSNNKSNSSILQGFTKKLSFTRVGNLPYREAYEFIVDPFEYKKLDK